MIEVLNLSQDIEMTVANEDHETFSVILEKAKNDTTNPLYKNYLDVSINDFIFVNTFMLKGVPAGFYGLQQKKWMPSNCARAYARTYKLPEFRLNKNAFGYGMELWKHIIRYGHYGRLQHWLQPRHISTLLVTRNVGVNIPDAAFTALNRYTPYKPWKKYEHVCMIQNTPQYVYWNGNANDVDFLREYHV